MDLIPILYITGGTAVIVLTANYMLSCKHSWEPIQQGTHHDGSKYIIEQCKYCKQFQKIRK